MILGIDPGQTGALAIVSDDGQILHYVEDMPAVDKEVIGIRIHTLAKEYQVAQVVIEQVGSMPGQGHMAPFKFGKNYGVAIGATCLWPQAFITGSKWKTHCKITKKKGQSDAEAKDMARLLAIQVWPQRYELFKQKAKGQARADAALLAKAWGEGAR